VHHPRRPKTSQPARVAVVEEDIGQLQVGVDDGVGAVRTGDTPAPTAARPGS